MQKVNNLLLFWLCQSCRIYRQKMKYAACPVVLIFGVLLLNVARPCRQRLPRFANQLIWLFVHADNGGVRVIRHGIYMQDILHTGDEFCVFLWLNHQYSLSHGLSSFFFNIRRMISLQTGSATPFLFASRVRSSNVQSA